MCAFKRHLVIVSVTGDSVFFAFLSWYDCCLFLSVFYEVRDTKTNAKNVVILPLADVRMSKHIHRQSLRKKSLLNF